MGHAPQPDASDRLTTVAIFVAPVLIVTSTFAYALDGGMNRGQLGGVVQFYAWGVVAIAFVGLLAPLRRRVPRTAAVLLATGLFAAVSGASYGIDSIWAATTGSPQLVDQELAAGLAAMAPAALLLPVTLVGIGVAYVRTDLVAPPVGYLLVAAALLFPAGRATNLVPVALATDALLLVGFTAMGRAIAPLRNLPAVPHTAAAR